MTHDEEKMALGETATELARSRKLLACLDTKVDAFSRELRVVLAALESNATISEPPTVGGAVSSETFAAVVNLCMQREETTERIAELEGRLRRAGVLSDTATT